MKTLLLGLLAGLLLPRTAPGADEPTTIGPIGTISPAAGPLIHKAVQAAGGKTNLLARIDWRSDIHRFSAWTTLPTGTKYPARVVGYKKAAGKTWYYDDTNGKERWRTNLTALGGTVPGWAYT